MPKPSKGPPRYDSRQLSERMKAASEQLSLDFRNATAIEHPGERGSRREESVRTFLTDRIPGGYAVKGGFAFDALDTQSKQLDAMIYRIRDTPFLLPGPPAFVPCESLLAAVEIKSELTKEEVADGLRIAKSIRGLKPFDRTFISARQRGEQADDELPRCFVTLFAFSSNLVSGNDWLMREWKRFIGVARELDIPAHYVDRIVVMDKGIINCSNARGHDSERSGQTPLQIWFVHLMNHLLREDRRRREIDIDIYMGRDRWMALQEPGTSGENRGDARVARGSSNGPGTANSKKLRTPFGPRKSRGA